MYCGKSLDEIRSDLSPLKQYWVVLYGSCVRGDSTPRSDIDVAVITQIKDRKENLKIFFEILGKVKPIYDIRVFELLPIHIKMEVIENYIVVFGDTLEISEYFYFYRKIWNDVKHRYRENQFKSIQEKLEGIRRLKRLLNKIK